MRLLSLFICLLISLYSCCSYATALSNENLKVEQAIINAMNVFNVPGVAVAIVQNNQIVFSQGFGVKEYGKSDQVTPDTLFGIASNTKAMTVALLAQLVDQYKISWQTKIVDVLPEFQLYNDAVTQDFTLIDLLSHRSGLGMGTGDLLIWPNTTYTNKEVFDKLKYLPQAASFRTEFAYNNLMYIVAGKVVEKITGKPWSDVIQSNLFNGLGMYNSFASFSQLGDKQKDIATPHVFIEKELIVAKSHYLEGFSSAGSVISTVNDMSLWLKILLNLGKINSEKTTRFKLLYTSNQAKKMWQPHTLRTVSEAATEYDKTHFSAYGLGWFLNDFQGVKLVHHSGSMQGMVSKVALIPEKNLGVVILTNQESRAALNAIYREVFEAYLGLAEKDWVEYYYQQENRILKQEKKRLNKIESHLAELSSPPLALEKYAQTYVDKWYGEVKVQLKNNKLLLQFNNTPALKGELIHYKNNTFIVRWHDRKLEADAFVSFVVTSEGSISYTTMEAISYLTDFSFDFQDLHLVPKKETL
ncbi:serine hydrolase [Colwellia sp. UCD-KL20]|uniref:serine hydrolase n=1 Tax=Colwellia sp. UCD-KL20 TaxID=1917165 RepID=UPI000970F8F8|nr:serine hydrolase [Colwellia sp. UCD-KL20]